MKRRTRKNEGIIIILSAPSGCGKTTVEKRLLRKISRLKCSISCTTRQRRKGERNGRDYFFMTPPVFTQKIKTKYFLEWAQVFGNYYGTPKDFISRTIKQGHDVLLTIDVQGARTVKRTLKKGIYIFLLPPSLSILQNRLRKRGTDMKKDIHKRIRQARRELREAFHYDYVVINDSVESAVRIIKHIINAEKHKITINKEVIRGICSP